MGRPFTQIIQRVLMVQTPHFLNYTPPRKKSSINDPKNEFNTKLRIRTIKFTLKMDGA